MLDWDDLRVFLAAARGGSYAAAAARLHMDATTIGRRIQRLEKALQATLFVRSPQGLLLTAAGARLVDNATQVETAVDAAGAPAPADTPTGSVRISASEGFGAEILAPALPSLATAHPGLVLELAANSGFLSLASREADIAITLAPPQSARLAAEHLTDYDLGLYASADHLRTHGAPRTREDLEGRSFVGYIADLVYAPELSYLDEVRPGLRPHIASSSIRAQASIIAEGGGFGVLPHFMAARDPRLTPVLPEVVRLTRSFWIAVHREIENTARVRTVRRWLHALAEREHGRLRPAR